MSLKSEKFKGAVEEIVTQLYIKEAASERIKEIKDVMKEEHEINPAELGKYASKVFKKESQRKAYIRESDLMTRLYEEVDTYE